MKYTTKALEKIKSDNEKQQPPSLEGFVPDLTQYAGYHNILEAAKQLTASGGNENKMMTALLIESISPDSTASLESIDDMNTQVSLEAAQEANFNKAKQEASKFNAGLIGWIKKTFSSRGKFFSVLDKAIDEVKALKGSGFELSSKNHEHFGEVLGYYGSSLVNTIEEAGRVFGVISDATFKRSETALKVMKEGTDFISAYNGIIREYTVSVSKELSSQISSNNEGVFGTKIYRLTKVDTTIGETTFLANIATADVGEIKRKDGSPIDDVSMLSAIYRKISNECYVTVGEIMTPKPGKLPTTFDELLAVLEAIRKLMDDVIDVDRIKAMEKLSEAESNFIKSQKISTDKLYASWVMCNSNVATAYVFYKAAEEEYRKVANEVINFARAAVAAKK